MGDALQSLEDQYLFLTNNMDDYLDACQTQAQKDTFISSYVAARRNYWNSINKIFHDDDPKVAAAVQQMGTAQDNLEKSLDNLNDIATVLNTVATAVKLGGELAGMVG